MSERPQIGSLFSSFKGDKNGQSSISKFWHQVAGTEFDPDQGKSLEIVESSNTHMSAVLKASCEKINEYLTKEEV